MEDRDSGATTLAALFRYQRRRIGAARRGDGLPAAPAAGTTTVTVDAAQPGFATTAAGTWSRWTDGVVERPAGERLPGKAV
jgi:hypothetical protein